MLPCDVEDIASVDAVFERCARNGAISIFWFTPSRFSDKNELKGRYADTTRENFSRTMLISCFSFTELAKRAAELMPESGGAMITLTFGGSMRVMPNYNVMGVAKAALEASVRYLAADFGPRGIRINAISAGPIRTLAGSGIGDARAMFAFQQKHSPLGRGVTLDELGGSALYLLSDLSGGVTGEIHYVDSGYNIISMPRPDDLKERRGIVHLVSRLSASHECSCARLDRAILYSAAYSAQPLLSLDYCGRPVQAGRCTACECDEVEPISTPPPSSPRAGTPAAPRSDRYRRRKTAATAPS